VHQLALYLKRAVLALQSRILTRIETCHAECAVVQAGILAEMPPIIMITAVEQPL
jgi:hypothetical protein